MEYELGCKRHSRDYKADPNWRNRNYQKTIIDKSGSEIRIKVPKDPDGDYVNKRLIPKGLKQIEGFDNQIISMYVLEK